jgi:hypothetical protein
MASRRLKLRRADSCSICGSTLAASTEAYWDASARNVTCLSCHSAGVTPRGTDAAPFERGTAGASAGREYERRKQNRERRVREKHPQIGRLLLALAGEPQHQSAFHRGESGERAVAESLERRTEEGSAVLLHDRRMPKGRGNIDHLAVAPTGIYVIDAKDWKGKVRVSAPLFGTPKLTIGGRDRTKLIDGLDRQVSAVLAALGERSGWPVQGVLCFTQADLPLLGTTSMRSHLLLYRRALAKRLNSEGPQSTAEVDEMARVLAAAFPPA